MSNSITFLHNLRRGIQHRIKKYLHNKYSEVNINWFYLKYLKHLPQGKVRIHNLFNNKTKFYNGPEYLHGINEIFVEEVYKQQLPSNALILDCGAHIGLSIIYLKRLCPTAKIIAFEPDNDNFQLLNSNIVSHKFMNVTLLNKAVWVENTLISFKSEGNMGSKIELDNNNANKIEAIRLKDYLNKKVDFLKLDIEGVEYAVLKDIQDNLDNVDRMFVEYHGSFSQNNELCEMLNIIERKGFKFYIKEAANLYNHPFILKKAGSSNYDVQLNIFCFKL